VALKLFDDILETCKKRNISKVYFAGDFFDSRKNLSILTIELAQYICKRYFEDEGIDLYLIRGNHDTFYKDRPEPYSLSFLNHYKHIHVIGKEVVEVDNIYLVPWEGNLDKIPDNSYVIGHFEINGFMTNSSGTMQHGCKLSPSDLKRFKKVISGHFHTPSIQNNIEYIGSAFAMDFNDVNSKRGYYILKNEELEFIEFVNAPKFIKLTTESEFVNIEGNKIKLIFVKDYGTVQNEKILQKINDMNPISLEVEYKINDEEETLTLEEQEFEISDNPKIVRDYIKNTNVPENINKELLIKFIENLEKDD
jgi:DNA repair exonuclease SbcCD nuclease subunit